MNLDLLYTFLLLLLGAGYHSSANSELYKGVCRNACLQVVIIIVILCVYIYICVCVCEGIYIYTYQHSNIAGACTCSPFCLMFG